MKDSWKNIGLVLCVILIITLMPNYAQAKSKTEVKGIPQVSIFKQDKGFGIWNLVIKTREGRSVVCYEDGRNIEVMRNASDLVQSVIKHNNEHEVDDKKEIAVIGDYDDKNALLNLDQIICLESVQGKNEPQELMVDTDYNDKTAALHNRYVIFDGVEAVYNSSRIMVGTVVPFWWSFWIGNFGVNYAWIDPWGAYHYWRRPHIVWYPWDGVYYWRNPYFRRPYWRQYGWRPWYWKRRYRSPGYWGYQRGRYRYQTYSGPYFDCPDRKGNPNKRLRSQSNPCLRSSGSFSMQRRTSITPRSQFSGNIPRFSGYVGRFSGRSIGIGSFRGRR